MLTPTEIFILLGLVLLFLGTSALAYAMWEGDT